MIYEGLLLLRLNYYSLFKFSAVVNTISFNSQIWLTDQWEEPSGCATVGRKSRVTSDTISPQFESSNRPIICKLYCWEDKNKEERYRSNSRIKSQAFKTFLPSKTDRLIIVVVVVIVFSQIRDWNFEFVTCEEEIWILIIQNSIRPSLTDLLTGKKWKLFIVRQSFLGSLWSYSYITRIRVSCIN